MAIKLGKYSFTGPYTSIDKLKDKSGIYAIICKTDNEYFLLDVGESFKLRTRIENHGKKECWKKNCTGQLAIYVRYTPFLKQQGRMFIEQNLREIHSPSCETEEKLWLT